MRLPVGLKDAKVALGLVAGMLLAGFVLPLAAPEKGVDVGAIESGAGGVVSGPGAGSNGGGTADGLAGGSGGVDPAGAGAQPSGDAGAGATATPGEAGGTAAAGSADRTASDRGVTPDSIKIGVALANLDSLNRTGVGASNGTVDERTRIWQAIVADANARGGAAGRKIEAAITDYDPIDASTPPQACRRLAEDQKVFAIFGDVGWPRAAVVCATRQYGLPNISYDAQESSTFAESRGLLWTSLASYDRILYNHVVTLHERGLLKGRKLGLVTIEGTTQAHDRVEIPALRSRGYELAHRANLSQDVATAQSQIPVEIQQMRSKGVDFILWAGGPVNSNFWINNAQRGGYNPRYSFSEYGSGSDDFSVQTVTQQIDAYAWSSRRKIDRRTSRPPAQSDEACVSRVSKATGLTMPRDRDMYWETTRYCAHLAAFVDAANRAGTNPTRQTFAAAMSNLGQRADLDVGPGGVGGSWTPGKADGPDHVHMMRHDVSCRCFRPEGDWFPMGPVGK